jgi:hypothetical protein
MSNPISNTEDVIDSREVIERLEELESTRGAWSAEEQMEFYLLDALASEGENSSYDWPYGATLIRDSYFKDYAMEMAEDIGMVPAEYNWPMSCIDWEQAARELRMDYTSVDFDGVTYWVRWQ